MAVNRRPLVLGLTLVVAIVAAIAVRSTDDRSTLAPIRPTALPTQAPPAPRAAAAAAPAETPAVNLQALTRERGEPSDGGRNPFRFQSKPPPSPPPGAATTQPPGEIVNPVPAVPAGPPPPPPIPLKFIGIVQKADGTRIAVLSDGRKPISGIEGQEVAGQYRILKIGNESIEMAYIDGRGRQTIRLTGQ
jgi:hypothetical protein